jgi:hypothetical protein
MPRFFFEPVGAIDDEDRTIEIHGCVAVGGRDLRSRTYPGGPTLVRGAHALLDENGDPVPTVRRVLAVCRCGRSRIAPLCDGTHHLVPEGLED